MSPLRAPNVAGDEHILPDQVNGSTFDPDRLRHLVNPEIPDGIRAAPEHPRGDAHDEAVGEVARQERRDDAAPTLHQRRSDPLFTEGVERCAEIDAARPGRHDDDRHTTSTEDVAPLGRRPIGRDDRRGGVVGKHE